MQKMIADKAVEVGSVDFEVSCGNVFADLGLANADKLRIKSSLVVEITKAIRRLGLTQEQAAARTGISQPKVSAILKGNVSNLSERKLMECLNRLGYDIEITVKPASAAIGQIMVGVA